MTSPLYRALKENIEQCRERFYMPGHKGKLPFPLDGCAPYDVTELELTGCLYDGEGAPAELENEFSKLYQSGASLLSTGGSTLCIQTMLSLFCRPGSKVIMSRTAHHAAVNASVLLDLEPVWLMPDEAAGAAIGGRITPAAVQAAIEKTPDAAAVYITSPDYFGTLCDIKVIAEVCRKFGKPLLVDNAHGAHFKFFKGLHPIEAGADCCCDSLHKTLPALTGAALLHLKEGRLKSEARRRMKHFGSTSPSYLIMLSCDMLLPEWQQLKEQYLVLAQEVAEIKAAAQQKGVWAALEDGMRDPVRITLLFPEGKREETLGLLKTLGIEAEYVSPRHIVLLPSPENDLSVVFKLIDALTPLNEQPSLPPVELPQKVMTPREAALSPAEVVSVDRSVGRIASNPTAPCPPGAAIVMPGELIAEDTVLQLKKHGVETLSVVKR